MTENERNVIRQALESAQRELENRDWNRQALVIDASPDELDRIRHTRDHDYAMSNLERDWQDAADRQARTPASGVGGPLVITA